MNESLDIAGHLFTNGVCVRELTTGERAGQRCGRLLVDIIPTTSADVDKPGIAHSGNLNQSELESIEKYREKLFKNIENATAGVAAGAGR